MQLRPLPLLVTSNVEAAEPADVGASSTTERGSDCVTLLGTSPSAICGVTQVANPPGLAEATSGVSAARPRTAPHSVAQIRARERVAGIAYGLDLSSVLPTQTDSGRAGAIDEARRYFYDQRDAIIRELQLVRPEATKDAAGEFGDEWIARNVARYSKQLDGHGDGMRAITAIGLLITIAREADVARAEGRSFSHPLLEAAYLTRDEMRRDLVKSGLSEQEAGFELTNIGERLRGSTEGYEKELTALREQPYYKVPKVADPVPAVTPRRSRREVYMAAVVELSPHEANVRQNVVDQASAEAREHAEQVATSSNLAQRYVRNGKVIGGPIGSL